MLKVLSKCVYNLLNYAANCRFKSCFLLTKNCAQWSRIYKKNLGFFKIKFTQLLFGLLPSTAPQTFIQIRSRIFEYRHARGHWSGVFNLLKKFDHSRKKTLPFWRECYMTHGIPARMYAAGADGGRKRECAFIDIANEHGSVTCRTGR